MSKDGKKEKNKKAEKQDTEKVFQCGNCGAVSEKKKKLCKPEKIKLSKVDGKDLKRKPCGK